MSVPLSILFIYLCFVPRVIYNSNKLIYMYFAALQHKADKESTNNMDWCWPLRLLKKKVENADKSSDCKLFRVPLPRISNDFPSESGSSFEDFSAQSEMLPKFEDHPQEILSTISTICVPVPKKESKSMSDYPVTFHFRPLQIPLPKTSKAKLRPNPKRRFDFYISDINIDEDVLQPLKCLCLTKCYPKYAHHVKDRRFIGVERITGCKFAVDDEIDPKKLLKLLKTQQPKSSRLCGRKFSIFGTCSEQLAFAIVVLTQMFPTFMSHAIFKSRLLLGFSSSDYYPLYHRMIFPAMQTKQRKRAYLTIPDNLIHHEDYFHLKKPKKSKYIVHEKTNRASLTSFPKYANVRHEKQPLLSLSDSWNRFFNEAGLNTPFSELKSTTLTTSDQFRSLMMGEKQKSKSTSLTKVTSSSENSSLEKISELSLSSLEQSDSSTEKALSNIEELPEEIHEDHIKSGKSVKNVVQVLATTFKKISLRSSANTNTLSTDAEFLRKRVKYIQNEEKQRKSAMSSQLSKKSVKQQFDEIAEAKQLKEQKLIYGGKARLNIKQIISSDDESLHLHVQSGGEKKHSMKYSRISTDDAQKRTSKSISSIK